jgi:toxin YhaV
MQYRLFFRFHVESKVIVLGWANDEDTKRTYGATDDAYRIFSKMLAAGHPPNDWNGLIQECQGASVRTTELKTLRGLRAGRQDPPQASPACA